MSAAERAMPDAMAALAAYAVPALWLSSLLPSGALPQAAGLGAGALVTGAAAVSVLRRIPRFSTPADRVTLLRAVLVGLCAAVAVPAVFAGDQPGVLVTVLGGAAFLLDSVDGAVARRTGTASEAGARFDAATDAALVLVLSVAAAPVAGAWTLGIGAMYYAFVAAGHFRPHLRAQLPRSASRKAIGAFQPFALLAALVPDTPPVVVAAAPALALILLVFSFGRDVVDLERRHHAGLAAAARATSTAL